MKKVLALFLFLGVALFAGGTPEGKGDFVKEWMPYLSLLNLAIFVLLPKIHKTIKTVMDFKVSLDEMRGDMNSVRNEIDILVDAVVDDLPEEKQKEVMRKLLLNRSKGEK